MCRPARGVLLLLLLSGCFTRYIADDYGLTGWFRADVEPKKGGAYAERFEPLQLGTYLLDCETLQRRQRDTTGLVIVLVHGIGGEGAEMKEVLPLLMEAHPSSIFMLRWLPYDERDALAARLAAGVNQLAACLPNAADRILVFAHSAGGVAASHAAGLLRAPVTVVTVASPLAGTGHLEARAAGEQHHAMVVDLGTRIATYPPAAPGVRVVHLRSHYPADTAMEPTLGHAPNAPGVGVPGAPQLELPEDLDHTQAFVYAARKVADGTWRQWLSGERPRPSEP
jgi:pimeloyl-ACP methyl ester carboxylesterase